MHSRNACVVSFIEKHLAPVQPVPHDPRAILHSIARHSRKPSFSHEAAIRIYREVAVSGISILTTSAIAPGLSATLTLPD